MSTGFRLSPSGAGGIAIMAVVMTPLNVVAQVNNDQRCRQELVARGETPGPVAAQHCFQLANRLITERGDAMVFASGLEQVPPRDLQSRAGGEAAKGGSVAQSEAVPTVQPVALAGGSVSAVGSEGGTDAIAAITINPAIFFPGQGTKRAAELSRLLDLTLFVPVNDVDRDEDGKVDYFGIRARLNVTGPGSGRGMLDSAARALGEVTQVEADVADTLAQTLRSAPDFAACIEAYSADPIDVPKVEETCGRAVVVRVPPDMIRRFRQALKEAREAKDAYYLGLDLRFDNGDPTLGAVEQASGTALFAALAFGKRFAAGRASQGKFGLRGRLGLQHVSLDDVGPSASKQNLSLDGALGFDFTYPHEFQPITLSAGLDFRTGNPPVEDMEKAFRTNYLLARISLNVPVSAANGLSIGFGLPIAGKEKPSLSVNANWQLLLSGVVPQ